MIRRYRVDGWRGGYLVQVMSGYPGRDIELSIPINLIEVMVSVGSVVASRSHDENPAGMGVSGAGHGWKAPMIWKKGVLLPDDVVAENDGVMPYFIASVLRESAGARNPRT